MAMNVNQDYSQFYVGTEQLKSYGSNPAAKKDTLMKYRFNTTDEHGNKVMDKMSKEETMKAVNEISSQYGDSVIVQFSGDGLAAALAEGAKSMSGRAMTEEEAAKRAARDAAFQAENVIQHENTHRIVIPNYGLNGSISDSGKVIYNVQEGQVRMSGAPGSYVDMEGWLKANDTELYNQINELNQSIINHKDGEKHSAKFIELYTKAAKKILDAPSDTKKDSDYADWKEKVEKTKVTATFQNVKYNSFQSFMESLQNQSSLSNSWISANISRFMKWLTV